MMPDTYPWVLGSPIGLLPDYRVASQAIPGGLSQFFRQNIEPYNSTPKT